MKPRLRCYGTSWVCWLDGVTAFGGSARDAYERFMQRFLSLLTDYPPEVAK